MSKNTDKNKIGITIEQKEVEPAKKELTRTCHARHTPRRILVADFTCKCHARAKTCSRKSWTGFWMAVQVGRRVGCFAVSWIGTRVFWLGQAVTRRTKLHFSMWRTNRGSTQNLTRVPLWSRHVSPIALPPPLPL